MSVAQKLCHEIVEPVLKHSATRTGERKYYTNPSKTYKYDAPRESRTTRSIVIHKKEEVSTLGLRDSKGSRAVIDKLKTKETLTKKTFFDTAINTLFSGPLKCDNNCVTDVRKRDSCSCKCSSCQRRGLGYKVNVTEVQTNDLYKSLNFISVDKASGPSIETANCGTQFIDKSLSRIGIHGADYPSKKTDKETMVSLKVMEPYGNRWKLLERNNYNRITGPLPNRRWALSQYPARGPDF